jgi:hypothetical protein
MESNMKINFLPTKEHYSELTSEQGVDNYISKVKQLTTELSAISISPFLYTIKDEYKEVLEFSANLLMLNFVYETKEDCLALEDKPQYQLDIEQTFTLYEIHKSLKDTSCRFVLPHGMVELLGQYGKYSKK